MNSSLRILQRQRRDKIQQKKKKINKKIKRFNNKLSQLTKQNLRLMLIVRSKKRELIIKHQSTILKAYSILPKT